MQSTLLLLASFFAAGIALGWPGHVEFSGPPDWSAFASIPVILAGSGACLLAGLVALRWDWRRASFALGLGGFALAGAASARLFEVRFPPNHVIHLETWGIDFGQPVHLAGRLVSGVEPTLYGSQFDVQATTIEPAASAHPPAPALSVSGKIRLRMDRPADPESLAAADALDLKYGDSIRALVRLSRPRVYRNPGNFDYRWWLESIEDVAWQGAIANPRLVEKLQPGTTTAGDHRTAAGTCTLSGFRGLPGLIQPLRKRLLVAIDRLFPPWLPQGRDGAVLKAVLLGDRTSLDSDTIESFRKVGLYHLLVIAGLHVGLMAMLIEILLRQFGIGMTARSIVALALLAVFSLLVEQRAPTLRATVMIAAYLVARLLYRRQPALNAVGLASLALLLARPGWLFESGFQLSFAAATLIAGLAVPVLERTTEPYRQALWSLSAVDRDLALAPRQARFRLDLRAAAGVLQRRVGFLGRHAALAEGVVSLPARGAIWTANMLLFSAVLQLGLLLPMSSTFHRVSLAGIGLNALAVPVMTVLLAVAIPTVGLSAIWPAAAALPARLLAWLMTGLFALTDLPGLPAWLSYRVPSPPVWVAWGVVISLVAAAVSLDWRKWAFWTAFAAAAIFTALIVLQPFAPRLPKGVLEVTALDCGAGDATWIVLPDQTTMLVGAGGSRSGFARVGAPRQRWDPGEDIVSAYLWSRGVKKIDVLVAPSMAGNRLGGFGAVMANFRVGELWYPASVAGLSGAGAAGAGWPAISPALETLVQDARDRGISIREIAPGAERALGGSSVQVLGEDARTSGGDDPVALRISANSGASVLMEGDIDEQTEGSLAKSQGNLASRVLEVARRAAGPPADQKFLARVAPRVALITSDRANRRDLPSGAVLGRLGNTGARLARTDRDGAITVEMAGESIAVRTFGP